MSAAAAKVLAEQLILHEDAMKGVLLLLEDLHGPVDDELRLEEECTICLARRVLNERLRARLELA